MNLPQRLEGYCCCYNLYTWQVGDKKAKESFGKLRTHYEASSVRWCISLCCNQGRLMKSLNEYQKRN